MRSYYWIFLTLFLSLSLVFYLISRSWPAYRFDVLMTGNVIMAGLSVLTCLIVGRQIDKKPAAFIRGVYSGTFLKLFVCMISVMIFALLHREHLHKPTLFVLFGIYAVYTAVETGLLSRLARKAN